VVLLLMKDYDCVVGILLLRSISLCLCWLHGVYGWLIMPISLMEYAFPLINVLCRDYIF
jgi:hypothetical protein